MAPEVPRKRPSMSRWLNKFTFVATDYRSLVKILTRPSLSLLFGDRVLIHPLHDTFKSKSYVTELAAEGIESTLAALGYNEDNFKQLDQFVGEVEIASKRSTPAIHTSIEPHLLTILLQPKRNTFTVNAPCYAISDSWDVRCYPISEFRSCRARSAICTLLHTGTK